MTAPRKPADHKVKVAPNPRVKIVGKVFTWTTEDDATITIPLRINIGVVRSMSSGDLDADAMFALVDKIAPGQAEVIDATDTNDFMDCFKAWQSAYNDRTGATLGESSGSST